MVEAIADEQTRLEQLGPLVGYVSREQARVLCEWMLGVARRADPGAPSGVSIWECVLEALTEVGCGALLEETERRELVDRLLSLPESSLWSEARAYVPDDRASAVLELSRAHLATATHYTQRDRWLEVGEAVVARARPELAAQWREVAAAQLPGTGIEAHGVERFAGFSPEQTRGIVLARLTNHQRRFLFEWQIEPWVKMLRERKPVLTGKGPRERAAARRALDALTATTAWPTLPQVGQVFEALACCAGDDAVAAVLARLVSG
jgi:hypothetical protein